ncbi:MAG: hypothetical protein AABZ06_14955 [Bdellovibrionota bacterium]
MKHGNSAPAMVNDQLKEKERETQLLDAQLRSLKGLQADKLLVTPFALRSKYDGLLEQLTKDPVLGNAALKQLLRQGLKCTPIQVENRKSSNPTNNLWKAEGVIMVAETRFSLQKVGGPTRT